MLRVPVPFAGQPLMWRPLVLELLAALGSAAFGAALYRSLVSSWQQHVFVSALFAWTGLIVVRDVARRRARRSAKARLEAVAAASTAALVETKTQYQQLVELSPDGIVVVQNGRFVFANPAAAAILGVPSATALLGTPVLDRLPATDRPGVAAALAQLLAVGHCPEQREVVVERGDGVRIDVQVTAAPFPHAGVPAVQLIFRDVTAIRRAERRQCLLAGAGRALAGTLATDVTLRELARLAVPAWADLCLIDLLGDEDGHLHRAVTTASTPSAQALLDALMQRGAHRPIVQQVIGDVIARQAPVLIADPAVLLRGAVHDAAQAALLGELQLVAAMVVPIAGRGGHILGALTFATTAASGRRYQAEDLEAAMDLARHAGLALDAARLYEEAVAAEQRARALFEQNPHPMWLYDVETYGILAVNAAAVRHYGYSVDEFCAMTVADLRTEADEPGRYHQYAGGIWQHRRKDGETIEVELTSHELEYAGRRVRQVVATDITQQRRAEAAEAELKHSVRLAALGEMVANVAHELKNRLGPIVTIAHVMRHTPGAVLSEAARDDIETIEREADGAAHTMDNLLDFARKQAAGRELVDLNALVEKVLANRATALRVANVRPRLGLDATVPPLWGDRHMLESILLNLVLNAEHAMRSQGEGILGVRTWMEPDWVVLELTDSGAGIPEDVLPNLFAKFFTTKTEGEGTGLGLAMAHRVATEHGGSITAANAPGAGAQFTLRLPISLIEPRAVTRPNDGRAPALPSAMPRPALTEAGRPSGALDVGGSWAAPTRVLVVDDEALFRQTISSCLRVTGRYTTLEAASGVEAIEMILQDACDVAVVDIRMPELSGPALWNILQEIIPDFCARIVFVTGDSLHPETRAFLDATGQPWLPKPFQPDALLEIVDRLAAPVARG